MWTVKALIRQGGCPGWSESSLGAEEILLVLSCGGSIFSSHWTILTDFFLQAVRQYLNYRRLFEHVMRKPSLGFPTRKDTNGGCSAWKASSSLEVLDIAKTGIILLREQTIKMLIRCAGWSASLLSAHGKNRLSYNQYTYLHVSPFFLSEFSLLLYLSLWNICIYCNNRWLLKFIVFW